MSKPTCAALIAQVGDGIGNETVDFLRHCSWLQKRAACICTMREPRPAESSLFGNLMIDSMYFHLERAKTSRIVDELGLRGARFGLVTLHRPSNVDEPASFKRFSAPCARFQRSSLCISPCIRGREHGWTARTWDRTSIYPRHWVPGLHLPHVAQCRRLDGFRRYSGRDYRPQDPLPDAPQQHRAPSNNPTREQSPRGYDVREHPRVLARVEVQSEPRARARFVGWKGSRTVPEGDSGHYGLVGLNSQGGDQASASSILIEAFRLPPHHLTPLPRTVSA